MTETAAVPSLVDSLKEYVDALPEDERADALHGVFYGFYSRVAIIDRTTHELAAAANAEADELDDLTPALGDALRDNALFIGQELFASRVRTMASMGYVSQCLAKLMGDGHAPDAYSLTHAVAFDADLGRLRTYALDAPGEHPDLPYDAASYDPSAT